MGRVDRSPAVLGGFDELEGHRHAGGAGAGSLGDRGAKPDSGAGGPRPHLGAAGAGSGGHTPGRVVAKIPNFLGAEAAADQLAALQAWEATRVVKANPDKAQRPVRARALTEGKVLYIGGATPGR